MSKKMRVLFVMLVIVAMTVPTVFAKGYGPMKKGYKSMGIDDKLFMKIHIALMNEEQLDLSDKQEDALKALKNDTKKKLIMDKARIEILALDINNGLWADSIDVDQMQLLVEQKYAIKKDKAMTIVKGYAQLKDILSEDQMDELKDICKAMKEEKGKGHM